MGCEEKRPPQKLIWTHEIYRSSRWFKRDSFWAKSNLHSDLICKGTRQWFLLKVGSSFQCVLFSSSNQVASESKKQFAISNSSIWYFFCSEPKGDDKYATLRLHPLIKKHSPQKQIQENQHFLVVLNQQKHLPKNFRSLNPNLEPEATIYKWLFQLDDSKSLHKKRLEITEHPHKQLFFWKFQEISPFLKVGGTATNSPTNNKLTTAFPFPHFHTSSSSGLRAVCWFTRRSTGCSKVSGIHQVSLKMVLSATCAPSKPPKGGA